MATTKAGIGTILFLITLISVSETQAAKLRGKLEIAEIKTDKVIAGVEVTLYEATKSKPKRLARAKTDRRGRFTIRTKKDKTDSIFFVTADVRPHVRFVTILGSELPAKTTVNELTTVASSYSMAQFYRSGKISGDPLPLRIAAGMNDNIVVPKTGKSSPVLRKSPNADETDSLRMTRSLANLMNRCARNRYIASLVRHATKVDGKNTPENTAVAFANLARNPAQKSHMLYRISKWQKPYGPPLRSAPEAWTVTVKLNDSGSDKILFGGTANIAFDSRGYAWIANNVYQGTPDSSNFIMVLQPNGKPSDGSHGTPRSPISNGGILGAGWGISIDSKDHVWVGNFGWGSKTRDIPTQNPPGNGSVSLLRSDGSAISPKDAFYNGPLRVQAIEPDKRDNIWIASFGNDTLFVFPDGDPTRAKGIYQYQGAAPFGVAPSPDGTVWVSNSGGLRGANQSGVARFKLTPKGDLERIFRLNIGDTLKVITTDSMGNAWLASQGNSIVYAFNKNNVPLGRFDGGGIDGPWGLTVDGEDNIWVANFGSLDFGSVFSEGRISKLCGANQKAWPKGKTLGDPISPSSGYRARSAGSEVLLANGDPLYGRGADPSYAPMMRQTSLQIDAAGNIWTCNNWKPDFDSDAKPNGANPGGDGLIIFVGLAPPPKK